jgi:hypothetical protein
MDYNHWVINNNLIEYNSTRSPSLKWKTQITSLVPTEMSKQSSTNINLSIGTRPIGSATRICTCPTISISHICMQPVCSTTHISNLSYLGFSLEYQLISFVTFNHILLCLLLSNLTHNQWQYIQALQNIIHASQPYNMNANWCRPRPSCRDPHRIVLKSNPQNWNSPFRPSMEPHEFDP